MSTKAIRNIIDKAKAGLHITHRDVREASAELEAIEKAAKDLDRLYVGDYVYKVRDSHAVISTTPDGGDTWEHPDVKAWGDAAVLMGIIAKETA